MHPFSEVQADEFVFEADPTESERGIFRVETTEPMICAIVWGETEAFGNFNNSLGDERHRNRRATTSTYPAP